LSGSTRFPNNFLLRAYECLKEKENKIKKEIDEKIIREIPKECTFHPKINNNYKTYTKNDGKQINCNRINSMIGNNCSRIRNINTRRNIIKHIKREPNKKDRSCLYVQTCPDKINSSDRQDIFEANEENLLTE